MSDNEYVEETDYLGCMAWAVENGTFALGMALMFSKTVDLMAAFAPAAIFGYSGIAEFYGLAVGVLIEGAIFVMKLTLPRAKNMADWAWTVLVILLPFCMSALAQVFDSFRVSNTLDSQPEPVKLFFSWFVPSIPTIIMALMIGKSIFATMPKNLTMGLMKKGVAVEPAAEIEASKPTSLSVPAPITKVSKAGVGFVGRMLKSPKFFSKRPPVIITPAPVKPPSFCPECHSSLPFIEYGSKMGKNNKMAKWPIYEKCKNPGCSIGRKNLALPKLLPGGNDES